MSICLSIFSSPALLQTFRLFPSIPHAVDKHSVTEKGVSHQRHPLRNIKNNTPITKCNRGMVKCAYEH